MSSAPAKTVHRKFQQLLGLALAGLLVVAAAGCGEQEQSASGTSQPAAKVLDHREVRQTGESVSIAAQLVPVPGYQYENVSAAERATQEAQIRKQEKASGAQKGEMFSSLSFHGVVADDESQNTAQGSGGPEVGFFMLFELTEVPPVGMDQQLGENFSGFPVVDSFDVSGTKVWVSQNDASPDSKYTYVWVRDGVVGAFDGATRPETEKWVREYLAIPALEPGETGSLSKALTPTPGYAFGNYLDSSVRSDWVTAPFGNDVDYSLHQVADADQTVGGLLLIDTPDGATSAGQAEKVAAAFDGATVGPTTTVGGTQVVQVTTEQMESFVWVKNGVTGIFLTGDAESAPPFLAAFLGASGG